MAEHAVSQAAEQFLDWRWRLNNLYWITDKEGKRTRFELNWAQSLLFDGMSYMNVVLKARQLGFTTFIQIFMLDQCVFNSNIRGGTIAHTLPDAEIIFRDKIKFPYDNLPDQLKAAVPIVKSNTTELMLANNSSIRVGTSLRSGTLQYLHVSEYGKICAKYPEKAREIRTGALNTVQSGQVIFIESTAEGQEGHFFDICETARAKQRSGDVITPLDFKFHFYPWWQEPAYRLDPTGVPIPDEMTRYFSELKGNHGVTLDAEQRAWYVKKAETQLEDMKREYPSTPDEAFEASVEGAYYAKQMAKAELEGRIGDFKADPHYPVHTAWDIGTGDTNAIWCFQILPTVIRNVGYYANSGEGMPHYLDELDRMAAERGWKFGTDYSPHDIRVKEWGTGLTRVEQMVKAGRNAVIVPMHTVDDGINAVRQLLGICQFDKEACSEGISALKNYRKEWDEDRGVWKNKPRHDWASHPADAFRYEIMAYKEVAPPPPPPEPLEERLAKPPTLNELIKAGERQRRKGKY